MGKIIAFCLGQTQYNVVCGGGMKFVAAMRALEGWEKDIVTTKHWLFTHEKDFKMRPILVEDGQTSVLVAYITRTIRSLFVKIDVHGPAIVYSPDDFMPDVLRAFVIRITNRNVRWVQQIFHLYLPPWKRPGSLVSAVAGYLGQVATHILIKNRADLVICDNRLLVEDLVKAGFRREKILLSDCGLDLDGIESSPADGKGYDCVYVGRINRLKGVMELQDCFRRAPLDSYSLRIIGGGEGLGQLRAAREKNAERRIRIEGSVVGARRFGYMKAAKVFVFMSHEEGWGIAIGEALACGLVCVVWDLPVYREVFPTPAVLKVKENDYGAFAKAVQGLLEDGERRKRLAEEGRRFVKRYDWGRVLTKENHRLEGLMKEAEHDG